MPPKKFLISNLKLVVFEIGSIGNSRLRRAGFTLVELIVVIGIIASLFSTGVYVNTVGSLDRARDAQRARDLEQIKAAVELYYHDTNCYPPTTNLTFASALTGGTSWQEGGTVYMKKVPKDPSGSSYTYKTDSVTCPQWMMVFSKFSTAPKNFVACPVPPYATDPTCVPSGFDATWGCVSSGNVTCNAPTPTPGPGITPTPTPVNRQIAWWKMDEVSGSLVADSIGGNNGTATGTTIVPGQSGAARSFNGTGDIIDAGNNSIFNFTSGDFSISWWVKSADGAGSETLLQRGLTQVDGWTLMADPYVHLLTHQSGANTYCRSQNPVITGQWQHWVAVRQGSNVRLYKNGLEDIPYTGGTCTSISNPVTSTRSLTIGNGSWGYFNGQLDDVRIYNYALSQVEITALTGPVPGVTTVAATNITSTGATFNATINSNGLPTNYWWQYGTSNLPCASLPKFSDTGTINSGSSAVSKILSGLTNGTIYYFCAVGQNSAGITYGSVLSFATLVPTPTPTPTPTPASVTISASFDGFVDSDISCNNISSGLRVEGINSDRAYIKFPLTDIPSGSTITSVQLQYNVLESGGPTSTSLQAYNQNGQADTGANSCSTRRTASFDDLTPYFANINLLGSIGSKTQTFPPEGVTDVQNANNVAGDRFSIAFNEGSLVESLGKIESIENTGTSEPKLIVTYLAPLPCNTNAVGTNQLIGCMWDNTSLSGTSYVAAPPGVVVSSPVPATQTELSENWPDGTGPAGMPTDFFSGRWKGNFTFNAGSYIFYAGADDGIRLYIDGVLVINQWITQPYTEYPTVQTFASTTTHQIILEYYEGDTDAGVGFRWESCTNGYKDSDGDGYGVGASGCYAGTVAANNTDCYDLNALAKPDQTSYFTTKRGTSVNDSAGNTWDSFDYDCNITINWQTYNYRGIPCTTSITPSACGITANYCVTSGGAATNTALLCH